MNNAEKFAMMRRRDDARERFVAYRATLSAEDGVHLDRVRRVAAKAHLENGGEGIGQCLCGVWDREQSALCRALSHLGGGG